MLCLLLLLSLWPWGLCWSMGCYVFLSVDLCAFFHVFQLSLSYLSVREGSMVARVLLVAMNWNSVDKDTAAVPLWLPSFPLRWLSLQQCPCYCVCGSNSCHQILEPVFRWESLLLCLCVSYPSNCAGTFTCHLLSPVPPVLHFPLTHALYFL